MTTQREKVARDTIERLRRMTERIEKLLSLPLDERQRMLESWKIPNLHNQKP